MVAAACLLASQYGAAVQALAVVEMTGWPHVFRGDEEPHSPRNEALAEAKKHVAELDGVDGDVTVGVASEQLAALSVDVDLLMIGSSGHGAAHRLMLGSTSGYLADHARCPLLVVPRSHAREADEVRL